MAFYREGRSEGDFDAGIGRALSAVLINPEFLFRVELDPDRGGSSPAYHISDLELASRLSFFLWSSLPDDELLDAAIRGELSQPDELARHTRRMLADPRSFNLASNFAGQWLRLRNLESLSPNGRLYPDFDDNLRQAFREETERFLDSVLREDRSVLDLLRADYTFLNERLAKHYGIPNVYGTRFRRVTLSEDSRRGGLLRHGSILAVTSLCDANVAGDSRCVGAGQHFWRPAAAAAAERTRTRREFGGRQSADARATRGPSQQPGVCELSPHHRPRRVHLGELRRARALAGARRGQRTYQRLG